MRGVIIRDGVAASGGLSFDLSEVLTALGEAALRSQWRCRDLWYMADDDQSVPELDQAETNEALLDGRVLLAASRRVRQVIDGEFTAVRGPEETPWAVVRAVDSSWWEVTSDDPRALAAIKTAFRDVEDMPRER